MRKVWVIWLWIILLVGCGTNPGMPNPPLPTASQYPTPEQEHPDRLLPWSAETADQLIQALSQPGLSPEIPEDIVHEALLLAIQEARQQFPQAPQAVGWRWLEASLQAQAGNSQAARTYEALIAAELKSGSVPNQQLTEWLSTIEPAGSFTLTVHSPAPGQDTNALLEFALTGQPAFYWLSRQGGETRVSLLASGREFRRNAAGLILLQWQDLTGDGFPEAWLIQTDPSQRVEMASLLLYDLASGSAERLNFSPPLPLVPPDGWQIIREGGRAVGIQVGLRLDGGSALCEYLLPVTYHLVGNTFQQTAIGHPILDDLVAAGLSEAQARLCMDLSVDWLRANASSGDQLSLQHLEALMPGFPYGADAALYVGLYPPDEIDRARFELGLNYARRGDFTGVQRWMSEIISHPAYAGSPWQVQAQAFLEAYQPDGDLRGACLASQACLGSGRLSLDQLIALMQPPDWADPISFLQQNGAALTQSGRWDFNLDGTLETWWLESTGGAVDTLRILGRTQDRPWLSRLNLPAGMDGLELQAGAPLLGLPVHRTQRGTQSTFFLYLQQDATWAPAVWLLEPYRDQVLQSLYQSLLEAGDVTEDSGSLQELQSSPYFNCEEPTEICQPSALLAYLTGLSLEQLDDLRAAYAAYQRVSEAFPESAYAVLARARLAP